MKLAKIKNVAVATKEVRSKTGAIDIYFRKAVIK